MTAEFKEAVTLIKAYAGMRLCSHTPSQMYLIALGFNGLCNREIQQLIACPFALLTCHDTVDNTAYLDSIRLPGIQGLVHHDNSVSI